MCNVRRQLSKGGAEASEDSYVIDLGTYEMSTTHTTAGDGSKKSSAARWSVLPDDLLVMVRTRVTSPHGRVRFTAVCKSWRAAAESRQPPPSPAVPLLLLSPLRDSTTKHLCGPRGCWSFRAPSKTLDKQFIGFHDGGWVAAVDYHALAIVNLFSGDEVELSGEQRMTSQACSLTKPSERSYPSKVNLWPNNFRKIVFSEAPTSSGCILAALTYHGLMVAVCKIGCPRSGWTTKDLYKEGVMDIAFCNGELYGLYAGEKLIKFNIDMKDESGPVIIGTYHLAIERPEGPTMEDDRVKCANYIFELHGKPAVAVKTNWLPEREHFIKVFELVDTGEAYKHKWIEVTSFGDYALFLGPTGSKVVYVSSGGHHGLERNHIYYALLTYSRQNIPPNHLTYSVTSEKGDHMFCREDQSVGDGVGRIVYYVMGWDNSATWLQHAEF